MSPLCSCNLMTIILGKTIKHKLKNFFSWKSSIFLKPSLLQQQVRRNRNDVETCTFSAGTLCDAYKCVPGSLLTSMIREKVGQMSFSLNIGFFVKLVFPTKFYVFQEVSKFLHSICVNELRSPKVVGGYSQTRWYEKM